MRADFLIMFSLLMFTRKFLLAFLFGRVYKVTQTPSIR